MANNNFFMVYVEGQNQPKYKHSTHDSALAEAKRLAKLTEKPAYVLAPITTVELDLFKVTNHMTAKLEDNDDFQF